MTVRSKTTKLLLLDSLLQERMAVLSTLLSKRLGTVLTQASRSMGGMTVRNRPSRWYYDKFKDDLHFYFLLAAIPLSLFTAYMNITVGEAKLVPIPEGYKPKEWEYYKNPISRLFVKYFKPFGVQQEYEMNMHGVWEGVKVAEMRALKKKCTGRCRFMEIIRAGTTERTLPSMPGSRGRGMCSTQSRGARTLLAMTTLPNKRKAPPTDSLYSMKKPYNKHKGVKK